MALEKERVCVTGAGGFLASWVVKLLLSRDYFVHGTAREPSDEKNARLYELEKASLNLKLFKADLLDYDSVKSAIDAMVSSTLLVLLHPPLYQILRQESIPTFCFVYISITGMELLEPAVKGTLNVLKACLEAKVKRVIVVSSGVAVGLNPRWPKGQIMDETCWSDKEYCRTTNSKVNTSSLVLIKLLKEGYESLENKLRMIVDVRDVAEALLLAYEKAEAEGRYICTAHMIRARDLVDKLKSLYPNYNYPKSFTEKEDEVMLTSEKLQKLGWSYRSLEETLVDSVESYKKIFMPLYLDKSSSNGKDTFVQFFVSLFISWNNDFVSSRQVNET
ncbi:hypothetical protein CUMW_189550 [Citrus unshiu]|uniref:NAD(P)-binding domain-containing protein n=1 Tax=Citrus unshiu TaxID=55188 RepID=A0A2H5Q2J0_CITUN|nr:hypothetical protein CUMW_189550 [Citrus unshiu]